MDLSQVLDSLRVLQLPMRTKFRGITTREVAIFQGPNGWGEFSPFLEYGNNEASRWLRSGVEAASEDDFPSYRESIPVNGTIPETDSEEEIFSLVALYPGVEVFKVKVGSGIAEDLARLKNVKKVAPEANLRVDVNGTWGVDEAEKNIKIILDEIGPLEYVEQPVEDIQALKELKKRLNGEVRIAGDEVIRKAENPFRIKLEDAIDVLMLKVAPLGGIKRSLEIARHHNLPVVVSSALESGIGISHGLKLAAALPVLDFASGLATGSLLSADIASHQVKDGKIEVKTYSPNIEELERLAASSERLEWWRERIRRCWEVAA